MFSGRFVQLEPLEAHHAQSIAAAGGIDRSTYEWIDVPATLLEAQQMVSAQQAQPHPRTWMAFVQRRIKDNAVIGMTNFLSIERWNGPDANPTSVEIGNTWLNPQALHSPIDTESKLLLMTHAFETWHVVRVQIRTDARNDRSRRALIRIGAQFEGVLRNAQPGGGDLGRGAPRDSAVFSVLPHEWPTIKAAMTARLG
jgi:N-acetyltransferase